MRITTIAATAGGGLLAAAVLALTLTTPPDRSPSPVQTLQSASSTTPYGYRDAVPATSPGAAAPRPAPTPLTGDQTALIDDYLAAHPGRADALAAEAARWKAFADANPELATELTKIAAMAPADRPGELKSWFDAHPDGKAAFEQWVKQTRDERAQRRADRRDRRQERRDRRQQRRDDRPGGTSTTPTPSATGSAFVPST